MKTLKLSLDLDGVMCDFEKGVSELFQDLVENQPELIRKALEARQLPASSLPHPSQFIENPKYKSIMWKFISYAIKHGFWNHLEPMPDMQELWGFCSQFQPSIITAPLESLREETCKQKKEWVDKHLGGGIDKFHCVPAKQKQQFVIKDNPTVISVLVDDKIANIERWNAEGGSGVHHTSASSSIIQLKEILTMNGIIFNG